MKKLLLLLIGVIILAGCSTTPETTLPNINEAELGKKAFDNGNYPKAVQFYDQWLLKYPKDSEVLFERARAKKQMKKYDQALKDFDRALAANPKDLRPRVHKCSVLLILGKQKEVEGTLQSILSNSAFTKLSVYEKFWAHYMDSQLKNSAGKYEKALGAAKAAIKIFELHTLVFRNYGSPYVNRFALYQRAVATHKLNNNHQAALDMERYISLSKQAGTTPSSKDYKSLALALYLSDKLSKCKSILASVALEDRKDLAKRFGDTSFFLEK